MPRNRGAIPPYGANFRLESTRYHPELANRVYALKRDPAWFIRSDKTSKAWTIFYGAARDTAIAVGSPHPSLTAAMAKLLEGIAQGFYRADLAEALADAVAALEGDSNDAEHDALYGLAAAVAGALGVEFDPRSPYDD